MEAVLGLDRRKKQGTGAQGGGWHVAVPNNHPPISWLFVLFLPLTDILIVPGARLDERCVELLGEGLALRPCYAALRIQVALLANNDTGDPLLATLVENLLVKSQDHVKRLARRDRVDEHVTVDADGVFGREERKLVLASSVDNFAVVLHAVVLDRLLAGSLNGGVVGVIVRRRRHKLLSERRLA